MGKLIYSVSTSLDGYVADKHGNFDWAAPSPEVLACVNRHLGNVGTFLFGRKVYEVMAVWDTIPTDGPEPGVNDFAKIWRAADKTVFSTSLAEVLTAKTILARKFDADALRKLIADSDKDFNIGGPHLAAEAMRAGMIDEYHQYIVPVIIGDGNAWLPKHLELKLQLVTMEQFDNGTVHLQFGRI